MLLVLNTIHNLTIEMTENLVTHSFYDTCTSLTREQKSYARNFYEVPFILRNWLAAVFETIRSSVYINFYMI